MNRTPEGIKKGLAELSAFLRERLGWTKRSNVLSDALAYIQQLEEREWELFDLLSSAWFTKACYFKQKDGTVYSRVSGEYMTFDQAIDEFARELTYDCRTPPTIDAEPVRHGGWIRKGSYMDDDFDRIFEYSCSICGRCIQLYDGIDKYPYCHCGAKMDLEVQNGA